MEIKEIRTKTHQKVFFARDLSTGLNAIIAIHNTHLGPAVGGTRFFNYQSEDEALEDVLRLSKGMTYKSALADIDFGGGKSVIIGNPQEKTPELMKKFGEFVNSLDGLYSCAEDVNTSVEDMELIRSVTPYVLGLASTSGDPSPLTALGVFSSIEATAIHKLNIPINQLSVTIQGVGHVGASLARKLCRAGAQVFLSDIRINDVTKLANEIGAQVIDPDKVYKTKCGIFAPCAMGGILNDKTIPQLNCKAVVGAANNQLANEERDALLLHERGILYAPDYLVNAGGIINVFLEQTAEGYDLQKAQQKARDIGKTLLEIYQISENKNILTSQAANQLAEKRFLR